MLVDVENLRKIAKTIRTTSSLDQTHGKDERRTVPEPANEAFQLERAALRRFLLLVGADSGGPVDRGQVRELYGSPQMGRVRHLSQAFQKGFLPNQNTT